MSGESPAQKPAQKTVLFVSKPVTPPWNDSSKNLVRDVSRHLSRFRARVMVQRGAAAPAGTLADAVYPGSSEYAPSLGSNLRVLRRLAFGSHADIWHFFFAPNPRSAMAGRAASRLRRVPTVQTVCSAPAEGTDLQRALFADCTVVLSAHTHARLSGSGRRLVQIPPAIAPLPVPTDAERTAARTRFGLPQSAPLIVYPGDIEFGGGAAVMIEALRLVPDAHLVMACRAKTASAVEVGRTLRARAERIAPDRIHWVGETDGIHALVGTADVVSLPSSSLFAKMDYPLVILEAMLLRRPVLVGAGTPAEELAELGAGVVPASPEAVSASIRTLLENDDERNRLGTQGREGVLERFDPRSVAEAYERVYDSVLR